MGISLDALWVSTVVMVGCVASLLHAVATCRDMSKDGVPTMETLRGVKIQVVATLYGVGPLHEASSRSIKEEAAKLLKEHVFISAKNTMSALTYIFQCIFVHKVLDYVVVQGTLGQPLMDAMYLLLFMTFSIVRLLPQFFREKREHVWYSFFMCLLSAAVCPIAMSAENLAMAAHVVVILRISSCFLSPCVGCVVFWNSLFSIISCSTLLQGSKACDELQAQHALSIEVFHTLSIEVFTFAFVCAHYITIRNMMARAALHEIEAIDAKNDCVAVVGILNTMSDAVVKLNKDLKIEEHTPKLADMLLHGQRSLQGACFEKFLASQEDRARFAEHMGRDVSEARSLANVFHLVLHDSMKTRVNVEVFHVCFKTLGDNLRHLLGVREHADAEQLQDKTVLDDIPALPAGELKFVEAVEASSSIEAEEQGPPEPMGCMFDPDTMRIKACSNSFARLVGVTDCELVTGAPLTTWLPRLLNANVWGGFAIMMKKLLEQDVNVVSKTFEVVLKVPVSLLFKYDGGFEAKCRMKLTIKQHERRAGEEGNTDASAIFTDIQVSRILGNAQELGAWTEGSRSSFGGSSLSRSSSNTDQFRSQGTQSVVKSYHIQAHEPKRDVDHASAQRHRRASL